MNNIAVIGSSGAIGNAVVNQIALLYPDATIHAFSRHHVNYAHPNIFSCAIDYNDEKSIENSALMAAKDRPLDLVFIATGILHDLDIVPEKSLRDLTSEKFQHLFAVNAIVPALLAKYFIPKLSKENRSVLAALSARVGSISDNNTGGWYAYRASKAALNMIIKTTAIETARQNKNAIIVGLHPGTVDSNLSKPFQNHVPNGKLFTPEYSAQKLLSVIDTLSLEDSGKCFAWDGQEILP